MTFTINVYHHFPDTPADRSFQARVLAALDAILQKEIILMADLSTLTAQVAANTEIEQSAVTLIEGIAAQLAAAATDPAAVQALADQLKTSADSLAAAITANTPAA